MLTSCLRLSAANRIALGQASRTVARWTGERGRREQVRAHVRTLSSSDAAIGEAARGGSSSSPFARPPPPYLPGEGPFTADTLSPRSKSNIFLSLPTRKLNNSTFKYASVAPELVRVLDNFPTDRLARLPAEAREDHADILATFRIAATLDETERKAFLSSQDAAQEQARERQQGKPVVWTITDFVAALADPDTLPAKMMTVTRLTAPEPMAFRSAGDRLFDLVGTAEEAVEVASWLIRVTQDEPNASDLLYDAIQEVINTVKHLQPLPPPDAYLALFASHAPRILKTFRRNPHPLVLLLETYTRLFNQERKLMDPVAQSPPPAALAEIDRLREQHLEATRQIHQAIQEVRESILTQRSSGSLMDAYKYGKSFPDVQAIWEAARRKDGTGVDQQGVAIYFDACGFAGALPEALIAWNELQVEGYPLNENNYAAYQECLCRCGAWADLVAAFQDQHARHVADPASTPDVTSSALAGAIKLADRLVKEPRHRSHHPVDPVAFTTLCDELESLVSAAVWAETVRVMREKERFTPASKISPR